MIDSTHIHTVHDIQWRRIVQRSDTTDHDTGTTARRTTLRNDIHTGNLTLQGLPDSSVALCIQIICAHVSYRTGQVRLFLRTVTDHDNFIQRFRIFQ